MNLQNGEGCPVGPAASLAGRRNALGTWDVDNHQRIDDPTFRLQPNGLSQKLSLFSCLEQF